MVGILYLSELAENEAKPEGRYEVKGADWKAEPGERCDGGQGVSKYLYQGRNDEEHDDVEEDRKSDVPLGKLDENKFICSTCNVVFITGYGAGCNGPKPGMWVVSLIG